MVQLQTGNNILHFQDTLDSFQNVCMENEWLQECFIYFIKIIVAFYSALLFQNVCFHFFSPQKLKNRPFLHSDQQNRDEMKAGTFPWNSIN